MRKRKQEDVYQEIAMSHGVSACEVRQEIQRTIDAAWNSADPEVREKQRSLFPKGKPSVEEFIDVISNRLTRHEPSHPNALFNL